MLYQQGSKRNVNLVKVEAWCLSSTLPIDSSFWNQCSKPMKTGELSTDDTEKDLSELNLIGDIKSSY